ncbi:hypothetical protein [Streptomyces sp. TRM68367]|uniref:hypothetical protein n=1 Tax=Streptomyces sp. TRM68367 TaxID=2758415 RepID=UPI00165ADC05|nr:hypothetical protein [Streptomyces sp. TRM68367]MBC9727513.1 hypothetical protein [Streptomyces sp. TRM68367]
MAAGTWVTALAILAFTAVGQVPLVAAQGQWSVRVLAADDPVSREVAAVCAAVVLVVAVSVMVASWRHGRVLVDAWRECQEVAQMSPLMSQQRGRVYAHPLTHIPARPRRAS